MKKQYLKAKVDVKANGDVITVVASDETLDRHGEVLPIEAWDLSKFKQAPRMLVDHDHSVSSIVGKWVNPRIEGKQLKMDAVFHDITELARAVKEMVVQKFLDTVSVGFIFNEPEEKTGTPTFELIETSWVTVPANPSARIQTSLKSLAEKISAEEKVKIKNFDKETEIEESDEILPDGEDEQPLEDEPEKEPELIPSEEPLDNSLEAMEGRGFKIVSTKEDFDEWMFINRAKETLFALCDTLFLSKLLERSEQLETLTQENKTRIMSEQKAKLSRLALKEAAGYISHALREMNKVED